MHDFLTLVTGKSCLGTCRPWSAAGVPTQCNSLEQMLHAPIAPVRLAVLVLNHSGTMHLRAVAILTGPQLGHGGHSTESAAPGILDCLLFVCFLHGRIRNPACKDPYTSQGLQGQRQEPRHAAGCTATMCKSKPLTVGTVHRHSGAGILEQEHAVGSRAGMWARGGRERIS